MSAPDTSKYLTIPEAAAALGIHQRRVYRLIATGDLPALKLKGRWAVLRQYIDPLKLQLRRADEL